MRKFSLVIEGYEGPMLGSYGFRIGQKLAGGQLHWMYNWIPSHAVDQRCVDEQCQILEDAWQALMRYAVGVQNTLL